MPASPLDFFKSYTAKDFGMDVLKGAGIAIVVVVLISLWKAGLIQALFKSGYFWVALFVVFLTYWFYITKMAK